MAMLSDPERTNTDLDNAGLAKGFDIGIKVFDLEREKPCLLLEDSATSGGQQSTPKGVPTANKDEQEIVEISSW
jgi:hypothetical protein